MENFREKPINRSLYDKMSHALARGKSVLLLGPRQTGKTTLSLCFEPDLSLNLIRPALRLRYEASPDTLAAEIEQLAQQCTRRPLVLIDEVQKVPLLLDVAQDLIDRQVAQFIFTGSSARKLRKSSELNLLPGRVTMLHMDALNLQELPPHLMQLDDLLSFGSLPGIVTLKNEHDKEQDLQSYSMVYLEEEVRAEALVRNLGEFAQFLKLAAGEAGQIVNLSKLSQQVGVSHNTINSYYQILEDCLIATRIEPLSQSSERRRLIKSPQYLFFDLGVQRCSAAEGSALPEKVRGQRFEQLIGLEVLRYKHSDLAGLQLMFWRDHSGAEVDWVVKYQGKMLPIEVKISDRPKTSHAKHLRSFIDEYEQASAGLIVCTTPHAMKLDEQITAVPWQHMLQYIHRYFC